MLAQQHRPAYRPPPCPFLAWPWPPSPSPALAGACGGQPGNRSLNSVHQPVVERSSFLDVVTLPGGGMSR
jgi:hypothetical protein